MGHKYPHSFGFFKEICPPASFVDLLVMNFMITVLFLPSHLGTTYESVCSHVPLHFFPVREMKKEITRLVVLLTERISLYHCLSRTSQKEVIVQQTRMQNHVQTKPNFSLLLIRLITRLSHETIAMGWEEDAQQLWEPRTRKPLLL